MANNYRNIDIETLKNYSDEYCDVCIDSIKEVVSGSGKIAEVKERHLPTIDYFLKHWLRREKPDFHMLKRSQFYEAKKNEEHPLSDTIKNIDEDFQALAADIVANEGKGIFYAKNKLAWTDRTETNNTTNVSILTIDPLDDSVNNIIKKDSKPKEAD